MWWPVVDKLCMAGHYTLQPDFEALLTRLPPEAAAPTAANTLWHDLYGPALAKTPTLANEVPERGIDVTKPGLTVLQEAQKFESQPVLYFGAPPRLQPGLPKGTAEEEAAFEGFKKGCQWALKSFPLQQ